MPGELSTDRRTALVGVAAGALGWTMPNSRKRRRQHDRPSRRSGHPGHPAVNDRDRTRAVAELPLLQATDAAEARGDAREALRLIERDLARRTDPNFWRPERMLRLIQLVDFGPSLPRWVTSRWILAQAAQHLDQRTRTRFLRALDIAIETRGGSAALTGRDEMDARTKVMDHDWVFRQVWLYELGALEHFVSKVASPDLLAGADGISDWMRAPMAAFRFVSETSQVVSMVDLSTGESVEALNIGSAALLVPGECAIGRVVPIEGGAMFESAPLFVPDQVALRVSENPAQWLAAVAAGIREAQLAGATDRSTFGGEFGLLSDVPRLLQLALVAEVVERTTGVRAANNITVEELVSLHAALVRAALHGEVPEAAEGRNPWPVVGATILDPAVFVEVSLSLSPEDAPLCLDLAQKLVAPASSLCRELAAQVEAAA